MKPGSRVNRFTGNSNLKMKVGARGLTGGTDRTNRLPALDRLSVRDVDRRKMTVTGGVAAAVIDQNIVAVAAVPLGHDDGAARSGRHGRAARGGDVEALMELGRAAEGVRAPTEG